LHSWLCFLAGRPPLAKATAANMTISDVEAVAGSDPEILGTLVLAGFECRKSGLVAWSSTVVLSRCGKADGRKHRQCDRHHQRLPRGHNHEVITRNWFES
jgi:hypothetical protein